MNLQKAQQSVAEFMRLAGQEVKESPAFPSREVEDLRLKLHYEEACEEFDEALGLGTIVDVADSIADSLVVIIGTACAFGIDIQPVFDEVMRSNMTKFVDGYRRDDGKWIKGPSYTPANIKPILEAQGAKL